MNEQQLHALVPAIGAVLEGHDFETRVSALMTLTLYAIMNNANLEDKASFAEVVGSGLSTSVRLILDVQTEKAVRQ